MLHWGATWIAPVVGLLCVLSILGYLFPRGNITAAGLHDRFLLETVFSALIGFWALVMSVVSARAIIPVCWLAITSRSWPPNYEPIAVRQKAYSGAAAVLCGCALLSLPIFAFLQSAGAFYAAYLSYEWATIINDI